MKQRFFQLAVTLLFLAIAAFATIQFFSLRSDRSIPVKSMASWQQADAPLGFKVNDSVPAFDPRFVQLTAFERLNIPTATSFSQPMGTEHGALTYDAQPFWSNNLKRGGHHSGDDLNGIGGMNTDLGDPVYAIGSGLVVYRGEPSPAWGNTLILAHRTPQGNIVLSMYAHLQTVDAAYGDLVYLGEPIASVGTAHLRYPAHLHFEMHESTGINIARGYASSPGERINPTQTIHSSRPSNPATLYSAPLSVVITESHPETPAIPFQLK